MEVTATSTRIGGNRLISAAISFGCGSAESFPVKYLHSRFSEACISLHFFPQYGQQRLRKSLTKLNFSFVGFLFFKVRTYSFSSTSSPEKMKSIC